MIEILLRTVRFVAHLIIPARLITQKLIDLADITYLQFLNEEVQILKKGWQEAVKVNIPEQNALTPRRSPRVAQFELRRQASSLPESSTLLPRPTLTSPPPEHEHKHRKKEQLTIIVLLVMMYTLQNMKTQDVLM